MDAAAGTAERGVNMYENFDIGHDLKMEFEDGYQAGIEAAQPKWISVEERLPEPNTTVLLIAHGWESQLVYIGKLEKVESEKSWLTGLVSKASEWMVYGFSYLKEPIVTHWMPLPSMPEPQKEDA